MTYSMVAAIPFHLSQVLPNLFSHLNTLIQLTECSLVLISWNLVCIHVSYKFDSFQTKLLLFDQSDLEFRLN